MDGKNMPRLLSGQHLPAVPPIFFSSNAGKIRIPVLRGSVLAGAGQPPRR
jgi:hypothetical protein